MNTRKAEMLDFMKRNSITVPEPLPTKPVLLERIKMANIQMEFAIDSTAFENGHLVLRLPPYRCCLNAIELVWYQLKSKVRRQNVYADQPEKVLQMIKESCDEVTGEHCSNYVEHVMNEELRFRERDNEIESVVVDLTDNESDDDIWVIHTKGRHFRMEKKISDFKLLTLELLKLHHQSLKLKFLKCAAQVTTDLEPVSAQNLCPKINDTFVMVV